MTRHDLEAWALLLEARDRVGQALGLRAGALADQGKARKQAQEIYFALEALCRSLDKGAAGGVAEAGRQSAER